MRDRKRVRGTQEEALGQPGRGRREKIGKSLNYGSRTLCESLTEEMSGLGCMLRIGWFFIWGVPVQELADPGGGRGEAPDVKAEIQKMKDNVSTEGRAEASRGSCRK